MVDAQELRKIFAMSRGRTVEAVAGATFNVARGEILGLLGPNGAGKTTLLRMVGALIRPTGGRCAIAGHFTDENPDEVRRHTGFLSGNTKLYGRLTPREILGYFGRLYGMTPAEIAARTQELAEVLDMSAFIDRRCETLSTGQTQKASIARVLLHDPEVLILDEPTLGLDILTSRAILDFISGARDRGRSVLFSTHYLTEAELLCDRVGLIHRGRILALGTKEALCEQTGAGNLKDAFLTLVDEAAEESA